MSTSDTGPALSGVSGRILVVEDQPDTLLALRTELEAGGYEVFLAQKGGRALEIARAEQPDVVLLDLVLPDMDGREVAAGLQTNPATAGIPVVVLTATPRDREGELLASGVYDYMPKPASRTTLHERVGKAVRSRPRYTRAEDQEFLLTLACEDRERPTLTVSGAATSIVQGARDRRLDLNPAIFAQRFDAALSQTTWRDHARTLGHDVYTRVFRDHPDILRTATFYSPRNAPQLAAYRFQIPRDHLGVPFETLFDGPATGGGQYLVLKHPVSRFVTGINGSRQPPSRQFFERLGDEGAPLRVLLIASNTAPAIPGVDAEIAKLATWIPEQFRRKRIRVEIDVLPTEEASLPAVRERLRNCRAHIVHYAGHGQYVEPSSEDSGLLFWSGNGRQGQVERLAATSLEHLLAGSETRFFYLSCCEGTASATRFKDDYLGVADALVDARVPSVLGLRRPVADASALKLAEQFYAGLARYGELDRALLEARRDLAEVRDDITWLTPVLIVQG